MRVLEIWLSAVGCPLSVGEGDGQTRFFGPILRASPSPIPVGHEGGRSKFLVSP